MIDAVKDFGCSPSVDMSGPYQAAIDAAAQGQNPQEVYLSGASIIYRSSKPIRVYDGVQLRGDGPESTIFQSGLGRGPILVAAPPVSVMGTPPIGTDSIGQFYPFDGSNTYAYDLGMDYGVDVNGLSQFCVEAHIICTPHFIGSPSIIVSSSGRKLSSDLVTSAFSIGVQGVPGTQGILIGWLTINGTKYSLSSGGTNLLSIGQIYHAALTYDGSVIRLWLGIPGQQSVLVASLAVSGTITQLYTEDVIMGPSSQDWPYCTLLNSCFVGNIYSLRFSNVARWTQPFTAPNAPLRQDGNTILYLDPTRGTFDMFIQTPDHSYIPVRWLNKVFSGGVGNFQMRDMGIGGSSGVLMMYAQNCRLDNVNIANDGRYSVNAWNNCFDNAVDSSRIGGARLGFVGSIASGPWTFSGKVFMEGGLCPFVLANGSLDVEELNLVPTSSTQDGMVMKACGGNSTLKATIQIDAETGDGSVSLDSLQNFLLEGGSIDALSKPPLTINGGGGGACNGVEFIGSNPEMIHIVNPPTNPIELEACNKPPSASWSNNPGSIKVI